VLTLLERSYVWVFGAAWRVDLNSLFDPKYYVSMNPDVAVSGVDPLFHFLRYGAREKRQPHPLFDTGYYLERYADVARSGKNPLLHFLRFGGLEGRWPSPDFDSAFYLASNPDAAAKKINPLVHFLKHRPIHVGLPHTENSHAFHVTRRSVSEILTASASPGYTEGEFFPLPLADPALSRTDWTPVEGKAHSWRAATADPGIVCAAGFQASAMRFFVVVMSCRCDQPLPHAQIFWSSKRRPGFNERLSIRFPLLADGQEHAYILDLHAGADPGSLNHLWWHDGTIDAIRFDPLDMPGEFTIAVAGFAHLDRLEAKGARDALRLAPLRTELSWRYLRGSGIEIGALQNPIAVRPDTHVRYADRLTLAEARAHYPELNSMALVDPAIICDAAVLGPVADRSVDFVIANHVLEHLVDPLAALGEWLRVVRPGGYVYVAIPEHTNPLDKLRNVTELDHLIADFKCRGERQKFDRDHYREWVASTRPDFSAEQRANYEEDLVSRGYSIHFHTFSQKTFSGLLAVAQEYFPVELMEFRRTYGTPSNEFIAILRKR